MKEKKKRHMVQVSHEAYELLRKEAHENRRTLIGQIDVRLDINSYDKRANNKN